MAEYIHGMDWEKFKSALKGRFNPNKAAKSTLDLGTARDHAKIGEDIIGFQVLTYSDGATFNLTLKFVDGDMDLDQTELMAGDLIPVSCKELQLTNTAQAGKNIKLILNYMV